MDVRGGGCSDSTRLLTAKPPRSPHLRCYMEMAHGWKRKLEQHRKVGRAEPSPLPVAAFIMGET